MLYSKYHKKRDSIVESLFFLQKHEDICSFYNKNLCCKDWSRKLIYDTMFLKCFIFVIGETNRRGLWHISRNMKLRIFS